jgi:membrane protein DedA with SNARE-associated domain
MSVTRLILAVVVLAAIAGAVYIALPAFSLRHEDIDSFMCAYGYYFLFCGTCLEGETIMALAGMAARAGSLDIWWVIPLGFCGSLLGDQTIFFVSRMWGKSIIHRFPRWHPPMRRINDLLERHGTWYMLSFRFFYGLRNPTPFVVGLSNISTIRFVTLNVIGAAVWSTTVGGAGYLFASAVEGWLSDLKWLIIALASVAVIVWIIRHLWRRRRARRMCPIDASPAALVDPAAAAADPPAEKHADDSSGPPLP